MNNLWKEQVKRDRDPELEEINRLALARIKEMEREIYEHTGLRLHCGIEFEFYTEDEKGEKKSLLNVSKYEEAIGRQRDSSLVRGSYIERFYRDPHKGAFEIAQGYIPSESAAMDQIHYHRSPSRQAEHMDRVRQHLMRPEAWDTPEVRAVSVGLKLGDKRIQTSALQVNISAYTNDGSNVFAVRGNDKAWPKISELMKLCGDALVQFQAISMPLAAPYADSLDQLSSRIPGGAAKKFITGPKTLRRSGEVSVRMREYYDKEEEYRARFPDRPKEDFYYLENCLPRANGNIYLAVLQTVAGVHTALMNHVKVVHRPEDVPKGYNVTQTAPGIFIAHHHVPTYGFKPGMDTLSQNHAKFAGNQYVRELLGERLHTLISDYFSPEAMAAREAKTNSAATIR